MKKGIKSGRKRFMDKCHKCSVKLKEMISVKNGIDIYFLKCPKCGEEFYTSDELIRHDTLTGKRKMVRKFGSLGNSSMIRIPEEMVDDLKIKEGDFGVFEKAPEGILIRLVRSEKI